MTAASTDGSWLVGPSTAAPLTADSSADPEEAGSSLDEASWVVEVAKMAELLSEKPLLAAQLLSEAGLVQEEALWDYPWHA